MASVLDRRVVQMDFDNSRFEQLAGETLRTLDSLDKKLDNLNKLDDMSDKLEALGASRSFDKLQADSDKLTFASAIANLDGFTQKFSVLHEVAVGALRRIGEQITDTAEQLVKGMSIEQVSAGWEKYGNLAQSTATIYNGIKDMELYGFESNDDALEYTEKQLEKLAWFTDETSYNFTDMTDNIGKFVSNNIKLDDAVDAMMGIANWAATAGANVQQASHAMYNISQAIGVGFMSLMDWKSIENAQMGTAKFKEVVYDTMVEMGRATKYGDGKWFLLDEEGEAETAKTVGNFREDLKKGWFDLDVMNEVFKKYGAFSTELYNFYKEINENGETYTTTSEILSMIEDYKAGAKDLSSLAKDTGLDIEFLTERFDALSSNYYKLGMSAFQAAQEAKTFEEAIDATKDAVSTQWMQIFKLIFGNYIEAKELWTDFANSLWDVFAGPLDELREMAAEWKDLEEGGRSDLIEGLYNSWDALLNVMDAVKEGFHEVFPEKSVDDIANIVIKFKEWSEALVENEELMEKIKGVAAAFATVLKIIGNVYGWIFKAMIKFAQRMAPLADLLIHYMGVIVDVIKQATFDNESFVSKLDKVIDVISYIPTKLAHAIDILVTFVRVYRDVRGMFNNQEFLSITLENVIERFGELLYLVDASEGTAKKVVDFLSKVILNVNRFIELFKAFKKVRADVKEAFATYGENAEDLDSVIERFNKLLNIGKDADEKIKKTIVFMSQLLLRLTDVTTGTGNFLHSIGVFFDVMAQRITKFLSGIPLGEFGKNVASVFNTVYHTIRDCIERIIRYFKKSKTESDEFVDSLVESGQSLQEIATAGEKVVGFWHTFWVAIKDIGKTIWKFTIELIDGLLNAIANFISKADFDSVLRGASLFDFMEFMKTLNNVVDTFADTTVTGKAFTFAESISNVLRRMSGALKAFQFEVYTEGFENLAQSLIEIAIAAFILASLDSNKIAASVGAIAALFAEMITSVMVLSKGTKNLDIFDAAIFNWLSSVIMKMATSVLILSAALAVVMKASGGDPKNLFAATTVISILLAEMTGTMHAIKSVDFTLFNGIARVAKGMATAISILAGAVSIIISSISGKEDGIKLLAAVTLSITQLLASMAGAIILMSRFGKVTGLESIALLTVIGAMSILITVSMSMVERLADMRESDAIRAIALFSALFAVLTTGISLISTLDKNGMSIRFVLSMLAITDFVDTAVEAVLKMSEYDQGKIWSAVGVIAALAGIILLIAKMSTVVSKDDLDFDGLMVPLIVMILSLSILLHQIDKISRNDPNSIKAAAVVLGISTVAIGAFVALLAYMKKKSKVFKNAKENLKSLIVMAALLFAASVSIALLTPTLMALAALPIAKMIVAMIGIATLMSIMATLAKKTKGVDFKDAGALMLSFISLGVGLLFLAPALMAMSLVPFSGLAKGLITIAGAMAVLVAGALMTKTMKLTDTITAFALAMALFGLGVDLFAHGVEHLARAAVIIMDSAEVFAAALATFMKGLIVGLVEAIYATADTLKQIVLQLLFDVVEDMIKNIPDLTEGAIQGFIQMLDIVVKYVPDIVDKIMTLVFIVIDKLVEYIPGIVRRIVDIILTIFAAIPQALRETEVNMEDVLAGFDIFKDFLIKMAELAVLAVPAILGIVAFVFVVGETVAAFELLGLAFRYIDPSLISGGGELIALIGAQLAKFVNAFTAVTPEAISGIRALCECMVLLGEASLINAVAAWFGGGSIITLTSIGQDLDGFADGLASFSSKTQNIDASKVESAGNAAVALASIYENLPRTGGFIQKIIGEKESLSAFATELDSLGEPLSTFSTNVAGVDAEACKAGAEAALEIAKVYGELPRTGGVIQSFIGEKKTLAAFGTELASMAPSLKKFNKVVVSDKFNPEAVSAGARAALEIAKVYDELPRTGGWWQKFIGEKKTLSTFGEELASMAPHLATFSEYSGDINEDAVNAAVNVAKMIAGLYEEMPRENGVVQALIGTTKSLSTFAKEMGVLGGELNTFMEVISKGDYKQKNIDMALGVVKMIADIQELMPFELATWLQSVVGHRLTLSEFGGMLNDLATPLKDFMITVSSNADNFDEHSISIALGVLKAVGLLYDSIKEVNIGGLAGIFAGDPDLATFGEGLKALGPGVAAYIDSINTALGGKTIDDTMINTATGIAQAAAGIYGALDGVTFGGLASVFKGAPDLGEFGKQLAQLGPGIAEFANTVQDVKPEQTIAAANAASMIAGVLVAMKEIPNLADRGFLGELHDTLFGKYINVSQFTKQMTQLGAGVVDFAEELKDMPTNVSAYRMNAYIQVVLGFANMLKEIQDIDDSVDKGIFEYVGDFFAGDNYSIGTVMDLMIAWAKKLKEFGKEMAGLNDKTSSVSIDGLMELFNKIKEVASFTTEDLKDKFEELTKGLEQMGYGLKNIVTVGSYWSENEDNVNWGIRAANDVMNLGKQLNAVEINESIDKKADKLKNSFSKIHTAVDDIARAGEGWNDNFRNGIKAVDELLGLCFRLNAQRVDSSIQGTIVKMSNAARTAIESYTNEFDLENRDSAASLGSEKIAHFMQRSLDYFGVDLLGTAGTLGAQAIVNAFLNEFDTSIGDNKVNVYNTASTFMRTIADVFTLQEYVDLITGAAVSLRGSFINTFEITTETKNTLMPVRNYASAVIDILTDKSLVETVSDHGLKIREAFVEPFNTHKDAIGIEVSLMMVASYCAAVLNKLKDPNYVREVKEAGALIRDTFVAPFDRTKDRYKYQQAINVVTDFVKDVAAVLSAGYTLLNKYSTMYNGVVDAANRSISSFISAINDAGKIKNATTNIVNVIASSFKTTDNLNAFKKLGEYAAEGIVEGMINTDSITAIQTSTKNLASKIQTQFKRELLISSPSKVMADLASWIVPGICQGIDDSLYMLDSEAVALTDPIKNAMGVFNENVDLDPTITPMLDLSQVLAGTVKMAEILQQSFGINADIAASASNAMSPFIRRGIADRDTNKTNTVTYNFTQNNNSPKALSPIDIYRQTNNELRWGFSKANQM